MWVHTSPSQRSRSPLPAGLLSEASPAPGLCSHVLSFILGLKSGSDTQKVQPPTWAGRGGGGRCPRGQGQRSKWSVGSCSLWVKDKQVCPSGSLGLTVPHQKELFWTEAVWKWCPSNLPRGTEFWWLLNGLSPGKQALPSPCVGLQAGLFPGNQHAQPPPAPHRWGCRSHSKGGGDSAVRLDVLGGSLSLWKARAQTSHCPGASYCGLLPSRNQLEHQLLSAQPPAPPTHLTARKYTLRQASSRHQRHVTLAAQGITRR